MIDLLSSLPGAVAQGLIWGIMAVGVYITYKLLDIADLTVDGSICTGAAVCTMMLLSGRSLWLAVLCAVAAGLLAGVVTGLLHIWLGIPPILAGILTQMTLWSVNLKIMGKANQGLSVRDNHVLLSQMDVPGALVVLAIAAVLVVAVLYLFFGTELGCGIRATGCNPVMSRAQGINTDLSKVIGLSLSNGLVALPGRCCASIRATPISTWAGAPWSSVWRRWSSGRRWSSTFPPTSPSGSPAYWWAPSSTIWCIRSSSSWVSTPIC